MATTQTSELPAQVNVDTAAIRTRERAVGRRAMFSGSGEPLALIGAMVVLIAIFSLINPRFASIENLQNVLNQASLPLIVGLGATLVILIGSIDLSVEGVMGAAGVAFVLLSANSRGAQDTGVWAWILPLALAGALGAGSGLIYTLLRVPSFIVTLGMWFVGLGVATILYGTDAYPELTDDAVTLWVSTITFGLPNVCWLAAVLTVFVALVSRYTRFGRVALAVGNNEEIARSKGMPILSNKIFIFIVAGLFSGVAGILATMQLGSTSNDIGSGFLFITIPAVVIGGTSLGGGKGGVFRTLIGVLLLTILSNGLNLSGVSPSYQSAVSGAILVLAIVAAAWPHRGLLRIAK
ncbi:MAG: ribose transport system permease protein [Alpinimonas sp.]|jgi:ribose transport system permease protein